MKPGEPIKPSSEPGDELLPHDGIPPGIDKLLNDGLVSVPKHFHQSVVDAVLHEQSLAAKAPAQRVCLVASLRHVLTALAVAAGVTAAATQTLSFVFGLWAIRALA